MTFDTCHFALETWQHEIAAKTRRGTGVEDGWAVTNSARGKHMRAIVRQQFGGPEQLVIPELPLPEPMPGHVVIEVKAFGLNHAETDMRRGLWAAKREK